MNRLEKIKKLGKIWVANILFVTLFIFCGNLFAQNQIGICFPAPNGGSESLITQSFTIDNPISGATQYQWSTGSSSPSTAITSGGSVNVDGSGKITVTNTYKLTPASGIFTGTKVTYTLDSKAGTSGSTTIDVLLIPQPMITPIPKGIVVNVCSNKIFSLPLSIDNTISATYGYIWKANSPASNQDVPVLASSGTQNLSGSGIIDYTISATIDTIKTGSPYKGYFFPNFSSCITTATDKYTVSLKSAPKKPIISASEMTICISSTSDLTPLNMTATTGLVQGWYQLSGKAKLTFTNLIGLSTQLSGFEGADTSKGPLAEEYKVVAYETNNSCDTLRDTISIFVWKKPIAKIITTDPIYFCTADKNISTITIKAQYPNSFGEWEGKLGSLPLPTMTGSDSIIQLTNSFLPAVDSAIYQYIWKVKNGHCNALFPEITDTISVIAIHSSSTASVVSSSVKACADNGSVDLYARNPLFGKGTWLFFKTFIGTGTPTFLEKAGTDTAITVMLPTITKDSIAYIFKWKVESGTCADSSIAYDTVYVYAKDVANITSADTVWKCSSALSAVDLDATPLKSAKGLWTLISKPTGVANPTLSSTTNASISVSNLVSPLANKPDTNMYVFVWSIIGTNVGVCGTTKTTDTVRIAIVNPPSLSEIKDGTPDTFYVCNTSSATVSIKATAPTIGQGIWTWIPLIPGIGNITIPDPKNPILRATATIPATSSSTNNIGYKLTWTVSNGNACVSNTKSIVVYTYNQSAGTGKKLIQEECATKNPQTVYLQTIISDPVIWNQLPPPLSDTLLAGLPNTNRLFSVFVRPPQGSAVGRYLFTVSNSSSKCSAKDTLELRINNPATSPSFTPGSKYGDTNYVCHITGKPDTLYGLSMRNDPSSTIGKGSWSQTNNMAFTAVNWFNLLTNKPDTMGSINLVFTDINANSSGTNLATYTLKWTVRSGACDSPYKNVVFVVANNLVTGVAKIKNKPTDGIKWLCGTPRDTVLEVEGGYKGKGVWTQITTAPYSSTLVTPQRGIIDTTKFTLEGLPFVINKPDTIKLAYIWNITLDGSKCLQTSADTIKIYIVSAPPDIPTIPNISICGNTGSKISTRITAPTPAFGQGFWSTTSPDIFITSQTATSAIVDSLKSPNNSNPNVVTWNLKNAGCNITKTQDVQINVSDGDKAQVKERIKYVCNDSYNLTIDNNQITRAQATINVAAITTKIGIGKWTVVPSPDGFLTIPAGTENGQIISPTLTIPGNSLAKDSTTYKLYWTTNSTICGITSDSTIIVAYAPLSDSISNGYNTCLIGVANANLSTTLFGPYIDGKSGNWIQDITQKTIGNIKFNDNEVVITHTPTTKSDSVKISHLIVPEDDSVNSYLIKRIVPATFACPEKSKTDTIQVYQESSIAKVVSKDTIYLCASGTVDIDTFLTANKPFIGQGFWELISQSNSLSTISSNKINDTTLQVTIHPNDSCIYTFRWNTFINTFCKDTVIGSTKEVYIIATQALLNDAAEITNIGSNLKKDTNWLCQVTSTQLTNKTYTDGIGNWRVISGPNSASVVFAPVGFARKTKVNVGGLTLPLATENDTSKYLIEFSIANGICDTICDTIRVFILRNASLAQLSTAPINPEYFCSTQSIVLNPPNDSTVMKPMVGEGMWTTKDSLPGTGINFGVDTIKWTWEVANRCTKTSVKRVYIIANNPQGDAIIRNKPLTPYRDTLIICLPVNKDTSISFNGNKPLSGTGRWSYFLSTPLTFNPTLNDSSVKVTGFSGIDSVRLYGLTWSVFKANFCPPSYDTAYIKIFRQPAKPIFTPDATVTCIQPNLVTGKDSLIYNIAPTNISSYAFGKFEWTIVRGDSTPSTPSSSTYIYIVPPTESQKTVKIVLKNANALTDSFTYIIRLKVSGGAPCGADSADYKFTVYPAIRNKGAFGYKDAILTDPGSKIIRVCMDPPDDEKTKVYLANKTLKSYQEGTWRLASPNPTNARFNRNGKDYYPTDVSGTTSIYKMIIPTGQTVAQYTTTFTITNKNIKNPACDLKDTVTIYLIKPGAAASPGNLIKSDIVCYGTTEKIIELRNPVGAISLDWEKRSVVGGVPQAWNSWVPNTIQLAYILPEIITEDDYRVKVTFQLSGVSADIGTCPTASGYAYSDTAEIRLKNKDNYRLAKIDPKQQEVCAESIISLNATYQNLPSELNGHSIKKWQTYETDAYGIGAILPSNNPWIDINNTNFNYIQKAPQTAQTIFYRAWIHNVDTNNCPYLTDTAVVYIKPKPKMSGNPYPICAENSFNFKYDSTTEGGYNNTALYPTPFTTAINKITWRLSNTASNSRTGMTIENGILSSFAKTISYQGINNDTIPLVDTVIAFATGVMGCESDRDTITFKVYPKARAELENSTPLVNCPPVYVDNFINLRDYKTTNYGYAWSVKDYVAGNTWTTNGIKPPNLQTNYAQNLAIELVAYSKYDDSATGAPCPVATLKDTLFSFGQITPNIIISDSVCFGTSISFTNNSFANTMARLKDTLMFNWSDKKDSLISTELVPSSPFIPINIIPYTDSVYTIKYQITNRCYSISNTKDVRIQSIPKADLSVDMDSICSGTTINIWKNNEQGNNPNAYKNKWLFGDGKSFSTNTYHFVANAANPIKHRYDSIRYSVDTLTQIISNQCGADTQTHLIRILPVPRPAINLTIQDTICGSLNKYAVLNKTFFGGSEPVSTNWYVNDFLVKKTDNLYGITDTLLLDTLWHSFAQYVDKNYPDQVKPIGIKILVTPTLGCAADITNYILVGSTAQPEIFIDTLQPCPPASFNIRATAAAGINTWDWFQNNNYIAANTSFIPSIQFSSGVYSIKLIVQSKKQVCPIDSAFKTVVVYGYPRSQFELLNPIPYCYTPFPAHYQSSAIDADSKLMPITGWYWKIDSAALSPQYPQNVQKKDFIYTYPLGGEYTTKHWVEDTRGRFVCLSDTITRNYRILGRSNSNFSMVDTTCATYSIALTNNSEDVLGYGSSLIDSSYWSMGDGSPIQRFPHAKSINYTYPKGGVYNISLFTKGNNGVCIFDTLTKTVVVRGFPKANFDVLSPCSGNYSTFKNLSTAGFADGLLGYQWTFADGQISNTKNPLKLYDIAGTYSAKLTASGLLCPLKSDTTIEFVINQATKPIVFRTLFVGENIPFELVAPASGDSWYMWLDKNKLPVDINNPNAQIVTSSIPGLITDTFYLRSTAGNCIVDNVQVVQAIPKLDVLAPTGFTPNNDGNNDFFIPRYIGIRQLNYFQIFDRFGQLMFATSSKTQPWDGTFKGKPLPTATYIWVVSAINDKGEPVNASGGITLIRDTQF